MSFICLCHHRLQVADQTCNFPDNFLGCENKAELGTVKFLSDDLAIECEGKEFGKCASKTFQPPR